MKQKDIKVLVMLMLILTFEELFLSLALEDVGICLPGPLT